MSVRCLRYILKSSTIISENYLYCFFPLNAAGNKSSLLYIDQVANLIYFPNMQLDFLYLVYFLIYDLLKSTTPKRKVLVITGIH